MILMLHDHYFVDAVRNAATCMSSLDRNQLANYWHIFVGLSDTCEATEGRRPRNSARTRVGGERAH
ncbi:hypothetical protein MPTK1_5g19220 [Marchantia polymorpha subsp. ruderalis]|uniref:Uncharacterized protein n=2 Tax=Marchantia polymorpha TaxID=3197 RepID=A0AAF6BJZ8_MARPO|nr:hypothetical protein MARPO_0073s0022 [Marchantia polymorpha]BBN12332.1 hypothetical protein Mp_5g19220 [Marchantia polymorpha subsp. ruderalis]|eukprot:PTQ35146.1 hypothetical protein MARPO_0073s0022 [Marchantia polymorpha]